MSSFWLQRERLLPPVGCTRSWCFFFVVILTNCWLCELAAQPPLEFAYTSKLPDGELGVFLHSPDGERRLTTELKVAEAPSWSPDGRHLAFQARINDNWDIYRMEVETGVTTRLTNSTSGDVQPSWSADGNTIAFVSDRDKPRSVWLMDADGHNQRLFPIELSGPGSIAWLKGTNRVLFSASPSILEKDGASGVVDLRAELFSSTVDGKDIHRILPDSGHVTTFAVSHDGKYIAFGLRHPDRLSAEVAIHVMNVDGTELRKMANPHGQNLCPSWLNDNSGLVFHNNSAGVANPIPRIMWVSFDGQSSAEIPVSKAGAYFPAIRPRRHE